MTHRAWLDLPIGSEVWWLVWADSRTIGHWLKAAREAIELALLRA